MFADGNQRNDAAFGAVVGIFVLGLLGAPLLSPDTSIEAPFAAIAGALLVAWAVDSLAFDSVFSGALSTLLQPPRRVAAHEAGHMLVSYLCGVSVTGYVLPGVGNVMEGKCGVEVEMGEMEDVYAVAAVGMAGVAAECLEWGTAEGGAADFVEVVRAVRERERKGEGGGGEGGGGERAKRVARWGLLQAALLLTEQKEAHRALTEAMKEGLSLEECIATVERTFDWSEAQ